MASKKVILKDENQNVLYPQTTTTQLITEGGISFTPQEELVAGTGISIASDKKTISTNLKMNGAGPDANGNFTVPTASTVTDTISNSPNAISSRAIYQLLGNSSDFPNIKGTKYILNGSATSSDIDSFIRYVLSQSNTYILGGEYQSGQPIVGTNPFNPVIIRCDATGTAPNAYNVYKAYYLDSNGDWQQITSIAVGGKLTINAVNIVFTTETYTGQ